MKSVVRSIYGAALQTAHLLGLPHVIPAHSTLNEKFNINANISIPDTEIPRIRYVGIGNGGHRVVVGANNISYNQPIQHLPRHAGLYNQLPFVLRPVTNDLTPQERTKYRLRTVIQHGGLSYAAYYLKTLDFTDSVVDMEYFTVDNGVTTSSTFAPNSSDLNPTPPDLTSSGVVSTSGDYIAATSQVPFIMGSLDIDEFANVANILYGSTDYAIISEIALCSGMDKVVTGSFNGVAASYTEAIGVQVNDFISTYLATSYSNQGIDISFDVGSLEAMLTLS